MQKNYRLTVVAFALSWQQALVALASFDDFEQLAVLPSDLVQQVFPLAHFFFFPLSANATPVTNIKAVANKNTFFMIMFLEFLNVKVGQKLHIANFGVVKTYKLAIIVTPPFTTWLSSTFIFVPIGKIRSTLLPNLIKPISSVCFTFWPTCK